MSEPRGVIIGQNDRTGLWWALCRECPPTASGGWCSGWRDAGRARAWADAHEAEHDRLRPEVIALVEELLAFRENR